MEKRYLEGIVNILGINVVLENVENPKLKRILHSRLRKESFNFHSDGYKEVNDARSRHKDEHSDNHDDSHHDNYSDSHTDDYTEFPYSRGEAHQDRHTDKSYNKGYSETIDRGYSEHTDHY